MLISFLFYIQSNFRKETSADHAEKPSSTFKCENISVIQIYLK
jgi:hypothetical protein